MGPLQSLTFLQDTLGRVYQVGGSVRDELMERTPNDYDFATPLKPDEIEKCFRDIGRKPYLVGKKFGTIGVKYEGEMLEVTTFRSEVYEKHSRKPQVEFVTSLMEDLSRRDFTINAMATNGSKLLDPFKGKKDIADRLIRCVGIPRQRFREDPIRILRAARFAAQLSFTIEDKTFEYMKKMATTLFYVSKERWCMELDKILTCPVPSTGLRYLMYSRVFNFILPELALQFCYDQNNYHHTLDLFEHTIKVVDNVENDLYLRWAALLHDIGKPFTRTENRLGYSNYIDHDRLGAELVVKIGKYLRRSNEWIDTVSELVRNHMEEDSPLKEADMLAK